MDEDIYRKVDEYFKQYPLVRIRRGQSVYGAEQDIPDIYWLRRGSIRLYQITKDGQELTLHTFRSPSFFPMMFYLSSRKSPYFFQASEDVIARKAPAIEVEAFLHANPGVLYDLTKRFADAVTGLLVRIEQLSTQNALQRICSLFLYLDKRFGKDTPDGRLLDIKLSHEDIASWVGTARETTSRQVEQLTAEGLIASKNRRITIVDTAKLQAKL